MANMKAKSFRLEHLKGRTTICFDDGSRLFEVTFPSEHTMLLASALRKAASSPIVPVSRKQVSKRMSLTELVTGPPETSTSETKGSQISVQISPDRKLISPTFSLPEDDKILSVDLAVKDAEALHEQLRQAIEVCKSPISTSTH